MRVVYNFVKMDDDTMSLEVWQGDWDLPSVDCDCLAVLVNHYTNLFCVYIHEILAVCVNSCLRSEKYLVI